MSLRNGRKRPAITTERCRSWAWRWTEPRKQTSQWQNVLDKMEAQTDYFVYGREYAPTTGIFHLQGYAYFKNPRLLNGLKRFHPSIHFEAAYTEPSTNATYCKKDGDIYESGIVPNQGSRSDLKEFVSSLINGASILELLDEHPANFLRYGRWGLEIRQNHIRKNPIPAKRFVIYIYGPTGCGKTHWVWKMFPEVFVLRPHPSSSSLWFDGYSYGPVMLLDDFRGSWMKFQYLLALLDKYPMRVPVKNGFTDHSAKIIIMTSDRPPEDLYFQKKTVSDVAWTGDDPDPYSHTEDINQLLRRIDVIVKYNGKNDYEVVKGTWDQSQRLWNPLMIPVEDCPGVSDGDPIRANRTPSPCGSSPLQGITTNPFKTQGHEERMTPHDKKFKCTVCGFTEMLTAWRGNCTKCRDQDASMILVRT